VRDVTICCAEFQNGTRGLKAGSFSSRNAALKGPLFHGIIGGIARGEEIAGVGEEKSGASAPALRRISEERCLAQEKRPISAVEERAFKARVKRPQHNNRALAPAEAVGLFAKLRYASKKTVHGA